MACSECTGQNVCDAHRCRRLLNFAIPQHETARRSTAHSSIPGFLCHAHTWKGLAAGLWVCIQVLVVWNFGCLFSKRGTLENCTDAGACGGHRPPCRARPCPSTTCRDSHSWPRCAHIACAETCMGTHTWTMIQKKRRRFLRGVVNALT